MSFWANSANSAWDGFTKAVGAAVAAGVLALSALLYQQAIKPKTTPIEYVDNSNLVMLPDGRGGFYLKETR
jgi:hypothetical protein